MQHEAVTEEAAKGDAEGIVAEKEKHITRLRAALSASERQRERQAASHKQALKALHGRLDQVLNSHHRDMLCDLHKVL